jgi:GTP cyclohydrolase IA
MTPDDFSAASKAITEFLRALGHDPSKPELRDTGARVASLFFEELLDGYRTDPRSHLTDAFESQAKSMVVLRNLATHIVCPHHLTIGNGTADVGYIPNGRLLGLGSLAKFVDAHAHRLVLQEDLGEVIVNDLLELLGAEGVGCRLSIRHGCLKHHGAKKRKAVLCTLALAGSFAVGGKHHHMAVEMLNKTTRNRTTVR